MVKRGATDVTLMNFINSLRGSLGDHEGLKQALDLSTLCSIYLVELGA
jgi:hypothetical protein